MRIGIDGNDWLNQRGLGRYLRCVTEELALKPDLRLTLFSPQDLAGQVDCECDVQCDTRRLPWYSWRLPSLARRHRVDVMFFPTNHAWWFGPAPSVVTIHDLACLHFPDKIFRSKWEAAYEAMRLRWFVRHAGAVCTDSEATKGDATTLLHCQDTKITVIPLSSADKLAVVPSPEQARETLERRGLQNRPFLLYTGGLDFRKNIPLLIDAFAELVRLGYPQLLVLVGQYGSNRAYFPDVDRLIENRELGSHVLRLEHVDDTDLAVLYRAAELFVFPSSFEGFGLPPLEAMAAGTPVVCSNASSLPEVVGDAAEVFDARDGGALLACLRRVLDDPDRAADLRQRGLARASEFSWSRTADMLCEVFSRVARSDRSSARGRVPR